MGMMGRYIDALSPVAKDRIITQQGFCYGTLLNSFGDRCLRGAAVGHTNPRSLLEFDAPIRENGTTLCLVVDTDEETAAVFARSFYRSGKNPADSWNKAFKRWNYRVVRAVKMRAANHNRGILQFVFDEQEQETVGV